MTKKDKGLKEQQILCIMEASQLSDWPLTRRTGNPWVLKDQLCFRLTDARFYLGNCITALVLTLKLPQLLGGKGKKTRSLYHTHSCIERLQYSMWRGVPFLLNWNTV